MRTYALLAMGGLVLAMALGGDLSPQHYRSADTVRAEVGELLAVQVDELDPPPEPPTETNVDVPGDAQQPEGPEPTAPHAESLGLPLEPDLGEPAYVQPMPPPAIQEPTRSLMAAEPPMLVEPPLSGTIRGPREVIVGTLASFTMVATPDAKSYNWSVDPPGAQLIIDSARPEQAHLVGRPGLYAIICSVANLNGHSAHAVWAVDVLPEPAEVLNSRTLMQPPAELDVRALVRGWLVEDGLNLSSEMTRVAQSLQSTASLIQTGNAPAGENPLRLVRRDAEVAIGPGPFRKWQRFFIRLEEYLLATGAERGRNEWANTLNNLAVLIAE